MKPVVTVFPDATSLSLAAAERFASLSREAIQAHGRFSVALSGGASPRLLYVLLGREPFLSAIGWDLIHFFWADERCVPPDHRESNYRIAHKLLLSKIPAYPGTVHPIQGGLGPHRAADEYERELIDFFGATTRFNLVILGVGADGHTASLFPGSPVLAEKDRLVAPVPLPPPNLSRVTLTYRAINQADRVLFIVTGKEKAHIASRLASGDSHDSFPALGVAPQSGDVELLLDREAASYVE